MTSLQWDRAFDSAEGEAACWGYAPQTRLQWDRAFDSAEGGMSGSSDSRDCWLQWDRAFDSAEGERPEVDELDVIDASMGPRI